MQCHEPPGRAALALGEAGEWAKPAEASAEKRPPRCVAAASQAIRITEQTLQEIMRKGRT